MLSKELLAPVLVSTLLLLSGCTTMTGTGGTKAACLSFQPITWSKKDSPDTIKEVKGHNAAYKAVCK